MARNLSACKTCVVMLSAHHAAVAAIDCCYWLLLLQRCPLAGFMARLPWPAAPKESTGVALWT
jgi:hypothetical protein